MHLLGCPMAGILLERKSILTPEDVIIGKRKTKAVQAPSAKHVLVQPKAVLLAPDTFLLSAFLSEGRSALWGLWRKIRKIVFQRHRNGILPVLLLLHGQECWLQSLLLEVRKERRFISKEPGIHHGGWWYCTKLIARDISFSACTLCLTSFIWFFEVFKELFCVFNCRHSNTIAFWMRRERRRPTSTAMVGSWSITTCLLGLA